MGPGTVGLAATQVNLLVNTLLATSQGTGAVSWLNYAFRLMYLPIGLFGVSIATAVLPAAARSSALGDAPGLRATVTRGLTLMLLLNVPATFGLIVLAEPIVRLLFQRGSFTVSDTAATAAALQWYAVGLVGYSATRIASPVFYAIGRSRTPVAVSVATIALNLAASLILVRLAGFRGLALGTSIAAMTNGAVLLYLLHRRLDGLDLATLSSGLLKIVAASAVMAAVAVGVARATASPESGDVLQQGGRLALAIGAAILALAAAARLLRIPEADRAAGNLMGWLRNLRRRTRA
jgi:putative peptidoglycan lipid II flippase